jgi:predicted outer membrane repeat protein
VTDGKLRLLDTVLSNNTARFGGAVAVTGASDTVTFRRVTMTGNVSTGGRGGGLYLGKARAQIWDNWKSHGQRSLQTQRLRSARVAASSMQAR